MLSNFDVVYFNQFCSDGQATKMKDGKIKFTENKTDQSLHSEALNLDYPLKRMCSTSLWHSSVSFPTSWSSKYNQHFIFRKQNLDFFTVGNFLKPFILWGLRIRITYVNHLKNSVYPLFIHFVLYQSKSCQTWQVWNLSLLEENKKFRWKVIGVLRRRSILRGNDLRKWTLMLWHLSSITNY